MMNFDVKAVEAIIISSIPIVFVLGYFLMFKHPDQRGWYVILGTLSLTFFYIVAVDPSLVYALYLKNGEYQYPLLIAIFSGVILLFAVVFFKRGIEEVGEG